MSRLATKFAYLTGDSYSALIPVEVSNAKAEVVHQQSVPLERRTVLDREFEPGRYLVRATLPSGEVTAHTVDLKQNTTQDAVIRPRRRSPRESLSWAYYLQPTPPTPAPEEANAGNRLFSPSPVSSPRVRFWQHNLQGWTEIPVSHGLAIAGLFTNVQYDTTIQQQQPGAQLLIEISSPPHWQVSLGQFWVQVQSGAYSLVVAVPPSPTMRIYIVDSEPLGKNDAPFRVLVGSGNPSLQSLLGFLTSGDFDSARRVGNDWYPRAESMLQSKLIDAVEAAVAGYFLLRAGEPSRLHDWTRNLASWITWLPDGPVIRAFHLLSQENPDPNEVRLWLLEAANRGIPLYTQGLRLLFDGLNAIHTHFGGEDIEIQQALETVRPYATAALWRSPVTCFAATDPAHPESA